MAGPGLRSVKPESSLIVNHILGPSYVSMDTALAFYGLIPERVYEIASMTTKASQEFHTPMGLFTYTHLPLPYYSFGLNTISLSPEQNAIIASPEKALCDRISSTPGLIFRSITSAAGYLIEKRFNTEMMLTSLAHAPKKESLLMVIKMIGTYDQGMAR